MAKYRAPGKENRSVKWQIKDIIKEDSIDDNTNEVSHRKSQLSTNPDAWKRQQSQSASKPKGTWKDMEIK